MATSNTRRYLMPGNRTPDQYIYSEIAAVLDEAELNRMKAGHNTVVVRSFTPEPTIAVVHYSTAVAILHDNGIVTLNGGGPRTATNADRMSRCVRHMGYSVMLPVPINGHATYYWLIEGPYPKHKKRWKGTKFAAALDVQPSGMSNLLWSIGGA